MINWIKNRVAMSKMDDVVKTIVTGIRDGRDGMSAYADMFADGIEVGYEENREVVAKGAVLAYEAYERIEKSKPSGQPLFP